MLCLLSFILDDHRQDDGQHINHRYTIVRGAGMLLFDGIGMLMLIPMRTITLSPNFKDHFKRRGGTKYLRCFRWMCFVTICNITYSALFVIDQFGDLLLRLKEEDDVIEVALRSAFALSFGSIYFSVWSLSQWFPWIEPDEYGVATLNTYTPAVHRRSDLSTFTQCIINGDGLRGDHSMISPVPSRQRSRGSDASSKSNQIKRKKFRAKVSGDENTEDGDYGPDAVQEKYQDVIQLFRNDECSRNIERQTDTADQLAILRSFAYSKQTGNEAM